MSVYSHTLAYAVLAIALSVCLGSCGDPSAVGTGVLEGERLNLDYKDDFEISAKTVLPRQQPSTYRRAMGNSVSALNISQRFLGHLDDPITGAVDLQQYFKVVRSTANPELDGATIDSVILSIRYGDQTYGDPNAMHTVQVYELVDPFNGVDTITADRPVDQGTLLGSRTFVPAPEDTLIIIEHGQGTATELAPQIRIPLDISIGEAIVDDPSILDSDSTLQAFFPGVVIESETTNSLFSLNLSTQLNNASSSPNGITIYYELNDTTRARYKLDIASEVASSIVHDFDRGSIGPVIDDETFGDSLLVAQGLAGLNVEIDFEDLSDLEGEVINFAELTMVVANEDLDPMMDMFFPPFDVLVGRYDEEDSTRLVSTRDFAIAVEEGDVRRLFGGFIEEGDRNGEVVQEVKINVTSHLKEVLAGDLQDDRLVLTLVSKIQRPGRTIVYGPGHSTYPMKLKVTFTDIQ